MLAEMKDLGKIGVEHFGAVYKEESMVTIAEVVKMTTYFKFYYWNERLLEEASKYEMQEGLHRFQKDKSPGQLSGLLIFSWGFMSCSKMIFWDLFTAD